MLRSHLVCVALAAASLSTLTGCGTDLGPCDQTVAQRLVYKRGTDGSGCKVASCNDRDSDPNNNFEDVTFYIPYFEGQALAHASCGNGGVCHSEAATGALRHGAPAGLDFDLAMRIRVADVTGTLVHPKGQQNLTEWIEESWELIDSGVMPPGDIGRALQGAAKWFSDVGVALPVPTPAALPALSTAEGKEIMRNWLACGAPVAAGVPVGQRGPDPIQPTWDDIHSVLISDTCIACHAGRAEASFNGGLILTNPCASWHALVDRPAFSGGLCATYSGSLVTPNDPASSLLFQKLDNLTPECGSVMPYGAMELLPQAAREAVRLWIVNGALPPTGCVP